MGKLLSVCIATYNRENELRELVKQILTSDNMDFVVEITDNCSDDGTIEMLSEIGDPRIIVHRNAENIGGHNNMVRSIFNGSGEYILYLNDRELFDAGKINIIIEFLRAGDYSYAYATKRIKGVNGKLTEPSNRIKTYKKGLDSLHHHGYAHHPSGMIYNGELVRSLKEDDYFNLGGNFKFSMLACDLMNMGETAVFDIGIWSERPEEYIKANVSGFERKGLYNPENHYSHPYQSEKDIQVAIDHLLLHPVIDGGYTEEEYIEIALGIIHHHYLTIFTYKPNMHSDVFCGHYRMKRTFVTTRQLIRLYRHFYTTTLRYVKKNNLPDQVADTMEKNYRKRLWEVICKSLKNDMAFLLEKPLNIVSIR